MSTVTFNELEGKHILYAVWFTDEDVHDEYSGIENCNVCLFHMDGKTYKAIENPQDGYRSSCSDIEVSDKFPLNWWSPGETRCS